MGIAQFLATLQVYLSNLRLLSEMAAVAAAGFQPVPNHHVLPLLPLVGTALKGGLFFTLSVGAALGLLAAAGAATAGSVRRGPALAAAAILWAAVLLHMNGAGFNPWATLYAVLIPPPLFALAWSGLIRRGSDGRRLLLTRLLPVGLLALGWFTQYDPHLFADLRDHLLMSNPVGERVSSFYYRYTLFPAESFKSRAQRQLNPVGIAPGGDERRRLAVAQALIRSDWLPVVSAAGIIVAIEADEERLVFQENGRLHLAAPLDRFLADPRGVLAEVSLASDRWAPFRTFTFYSVLLAFPVALYLLVFGLVRLAAGLAFPPGRADLAAAALCFGLGLWVLAWFAASREPPPPPAGVAAALSSANWQRQAAALRAAREAGTDLCTLPGWQAPAASPHPQVRYWFARALAAGRCPAASEVLADLLHDPHLNVRTMALESLAARNETGAIDRIRTFLNASHDWYDQLYAYRALRALGWTQTGVP
jgi:hypothetical protein